MSSFALSHQAEIDLTAVYLGIADKYGGRAADKYVGELNLMCVELARKPKKGRTQGHLPEAIRKHDHTLHGIFYCETEAGILIVRILGVIGTNEIEKAWFEDTEASDAMSTSRLPH